MRPGRRRWIPLLVVGAVGAAVIGGLAIYRVHLAGKLAELEAQAEELRTELEETRTEEQALLQNALGALGLPEPSCPPVAELDPAWARHQPWGPGKTDALPLLEGGSAEVRAAAAGSDPGEAPQLSWNAELRVYDLAIERVQAPDGFHLAVRLPEGGWARTLPSNWPFPPCAPWLDCARGGCVEGCLPRSFTGSEGPPPGAVYPEHCRGEGDG